jgi:Recombinational DNA repair ATPase (RecF pathway)
MPRPRDVLGALRTVLFAPEDLALVKGDPGERRRFLDELLTATAPRYAGVRADYERVLKQRTALLKSAGSKGNLRGAAREAMTSTLDAWDAQLARAGAPLLAGRMRLVGRAAAAPDRGLRGGLRRTAGEASGMNYRSSALENSDEFDDACARDGLLKALSGVRASELDRGVCLVGPHRDELELVSAACRPRVRQPR